MIYIDHAEPERLAEPIPTIAAPAESPEPELPSSPPLPLRSLSLLKESDEYPSPAFIKRARVSYGSLFEDGLDIFEDDGGVRGRGRKRTRFGRDSNAWRYSSQSRSPEPEPQPDEDAPGARLSSPSPLPPRMTDEASQTLDTSLPPTTTALMPDLLVPPQEEKLSVPQTVDHRQDMETELSFEPPTMAGPEVGILGELPAVAKHPALEANSLFGTFAPSTTVTSGFSMYGHEAVAPVDHGTSIAEQVRFTFSHEPHFTGPPAQENALPDSGYPREVPYPASYLDQPSISGYPEPPSLAHHGLPQPEHPDDGMDYDILPTVPIAESFENDRWDVATQSKDYNPVEGGHFGTDALAEGHRITGAEEESLHSSDIPPATVPPGFSSYSSQKQPPIIEVIDSDSEFESGEPDTALIQNEETYRGSDDEVGVEDEDEAVYDEDGEPLEDGDYDQREYASVSDDYSGSSDEENEVEREIKERYPIGDTLDEEEEDYSSDPGEGEEGEEYDEEEDYASEEEPPQPSGPPPPPASKEPIVIDLLDSSDEEDAPEPAPPPPPKQVEREEEGEEAAVALEQMGGEDSDEEAEGEEDEEEQISEDEEPESEELEDEEPEDDQPDDGQDDDEHVELDLVQYDVELPRDKHDNQAQTTPHPKPPVVLILTSSPVRESGIPQQEMPMLDHPPEDLAEGAEEDLVEDPTEDPMEESAEGPTEDVAEDPAVKDLDSLVEIQTVAYISEETRGGIMAQTQVIDFAMQHTELDRTSLSSPLAWIERFREAATDAPHESDLPTVDQSNGPADHRLRRETQQESVENLREELVESKETDDTQSRDKTKEEDESEARESLAEEDEDHPQPSEDSPGVSNLDEDVVMEEGATDEEASDDGLFARQPRRLSRADTDPDYVDHPDDELIPEEYEKDKVKDFAVLKTETKQPQPDLSPRSAALTAAKQIHEYQHLSSGLEEAQNSTDGQPHGEATENQQVERPPSPGVLETEGNLDAAQDASPMTTDRKTDASPAEENGTGNGTDQESQSLVSSGAITQPPPHPELGGKDDATRLDIVPAPPQPDASSESNEPREAGVSRSESNVLSSSPPQTRSFHTRSQSTQETGAASSSAQPEQSTQAASQEPVPAPSESQTSVARGPSDDVDMDIDVEYPQLPPVEGSVDVVMEERGEEGEDDLDSIPSPSAQLRDDMEGPQRDTAAGYEESLQSSSTIKELFPTSSPGPSQPQETPEELPRRRTRRRRALSKANAEEAMLPPQPLADEESVSEAGVEAEDAGRPQPNKSATPDPSVQFARQALAAKRARKALEPIGSSPRVMTRARSGSLQTTETTDDEADRSVALARASIASPSKGNSKKGGKGEKSATALKAELTKRLRTDLPECLPLKNLRNYVRKSISVVGIVTAEPSTPVRAKGGPREYVMSFNVTDVAIGPAHVVEVQLYRAHKDSLPVVKPGDGILLRNLQVQALTNKDFGLRSGNESAWAVYDVDDSPPQIKGPPLEDYDQYNDYMETLKAWYRSLGATAIEKVDKANQKIADANQQQQQQQQQQPHPAR